MRSQQDIDEEFQNYVARAGKRGLNFYKKILVSLLKEGANINAIHVSGLSPLLIALKGRSRNFPDEKLTRFLVENGADVFAQNKSGYTALHYAACSQNRGAFKYLLSVGGKKLLEIKTETGESSYEGRFAHYFGVEQLPVDGWYINFTEDQASLGLKQMQEMIDDTFRTQEHKMTAVDNDDQTLPSITTEIIVGSSNYRLRHSQRTTHTDGHLAKKRGWECHIL